MTTDSGLLVLDKPAGWTSHQVVGRCRRILGTRKVGHAGTLDPMATGVLLVGVNRATRLLGHLMLTEKEYLATIRLGQSTLTDDAEGETTGLSGCSPLTPEQLDRAMQPLRGEIEQKPTAVSAIKVDGRRSYARVRAGEDVDLPARPVSVHELTLLHTEDAAVSGPEAQHDPVPVLDLQVRVRCSSGTYVRALARDLGASLGVGGHLTALRRIRVGAFGLDQAQPIDQDTERLELLDLDRVAAQSFTTREVDEHQARAVGFGQKIPGLQLAGLTALLHDGHFLALYEPSEEGDLARARFVLS